MADEAEPVVTVTDLPMTFQVKYLGNHPAKGLWGMKHTRKPVDNMVNKAKKLPPNVILPTVALEVNKEGVVVTAERKEQSKYSVDVISYGVQDLVYTRVFSMIIVTDESLQKEVPLVCHSFVCDSRTQARQITYALASAFQDYGKRVREENKGSDVPIKRLAIDLRTPEEQAAYSDGETDA